MIPHLAYVDLPTHNVITRLGILKYSTVLASAKELGGTRISSALTSTKQSFLNSFGSIYIECILVYILHSSATLVS